MALIDTKSMTLATKYRPQIFSDLVEQDEIKTILQNQVKSGNLKHAYLFCGGAGTGKTTSCRIIANMINEGKGKPIELDCASNNSVDDMRAIQDSCMKRPLEGKYKIFILDECHVLTPQAWNSMLKILEEPPEYVIFLFATTDPQKILKTIMSRVQRFNFKRISTSGIVNRLKYILEQEHITTYEEEAIQYIARLARGGMRDSITTLEKCLDYDNNLTLSNVLKVTSGGVDEATMQKLLIFILNKQCKEALNLFNDIYMSGIDISLFVKMFIEFVENCVKFLITENTDIVTISDIIINWLINNKGIVLTLKNYLYDLTKHNIFYSNDDLKILMESWIIKQCN